MRLADSSAEPYNGYNIPKISEIIYLNLVKNYHLSLIESF